jgi:hypothetical protein
MDTPSWLSLAERNADYWRKRRWACETTPLMAGLLETAPYPVWLLLRIDELRMRHYYRRLAQYRGYNDSAKGRWRAERYRTSHRVVLQERAVARRRRNDPLARLLDDASYNVNPSVSSQRKRSDVPDVEPLTPSTWETRRWNGRTGLL